MEKYQGASHIQDQLAAANDLDLKNTKQTLIPQRAET